MISLRNENDLRIGMTYDLPFGMIDMTFIGSVSISRKGNRNRARRRAKTPNSQGISPRLKKKTGVTAGKTDKTANG